MDSTLEGAPSENVGITEAVMLEFATVERDDALKFAALTLTNLRFVSEIWLASRERHEDS